MKFYEKFFVSNTPTAKMVRTIVQGVLAYVILNLGVLLKKLNLSQEDIALLIPLIMAILSPIMSFIGGKVPEVGQPVQADSSVYDEQGDLIERSAANGDL